MALNTELSLLKVWKEAYITVHSIPSHIHLTLYRKNG